MVISGPSLGDEELRSQRDYLDNLTFSYYYEKDKIVEHINKAENNRSYTRSKYTIENERFQERIEVYPKEWCKIQ